MKKDAFYYQTLKNNIILSSDAYKHTHWLQYPKNTEYIYSYFESRGGQRDTTMFYGLQIALKKYLSGVVVEQWMIDEAEEFCQKMFGFNYFNRAGWEYILNEHGGKLPIRIKAAPEGLLIPTHNVLMSIENTDPKVAWLTNFLETLLTPYMWYGTAVATNSYYIKKLIQEFAEKAGENVLSWHLNDFGYRGVSSKESAGIGGSAHLINFTGTDTLEGIVYAQRYYDAEHCGFSVMAAEHSTVTIYGREHEAQAYEAFLDNCPDAATLSVVCDSYDTINAVNNIFGEQLKEKVLKRSGKLVVRPDSGDPAIMAVEVLQSLWNKFGGTKNANGYKVLNPKVGVIYPDGINYHSVNRILFNATDLNGFAPSNIVFGMGGALLQEVNRDTHKNAFKCSLGCVDGKWVDVYKDPITDPGKKSKRGRQILLKDENGKYSTTNDVSQTTNDVMEVVYENGELLKEYTFDEVKKNSLL